MNKNIIQRMGFEKEVELVEYQICPFCEKPVEESVFRNEISEEEYQISGLCQACQDSIFGPD